MATHVARKINRSTMGNQFSDDVKKATLWGEEQSTSASLKQITLNISFNKYDKFETQKWAAE